MISLDVKETSIYANPPTNLSYQPGSLCLNMIVKNESKIITRLLDSVINIIDTYCICDTGSTDNTIDIILEYFSTRGISGKVVQEPFRNFEYNRTFSLKQCYGMSDYVLLLDADMVLKVGAAFKKTDLTKDVYLLFQGNEGFYYKNVRILKNDGQSSYWGVTHEVVKHPPNAYTDTLSRDTLFILDYGDGGCKSDKYTRDIKLLSDAIQSDPLNERYHFYLGNSYHDSGMYAEAIPIYRKRIELGGWYQEVWFSYYRIGLCYKKMGDIAHAIEEWMNAYQYFPERLENIYEIVHYYRCEAKYKLAQLYCSIALKHLEKGYDIDDYLFLQKDVYSYKLWYEMSIIGYYCNLDNLDLSKIHIDLVNHPLVPEHIRHNVLCNYKYYVPKLSEKVAWTKDLDKDVEETDDLDHTFLSSTPSIAFMGDGKAIANIRYVNYYIDEKGGYVNRSNIISVNKIVVYENHEFNKKLYETTLKHDPSLDGVYVGLEDVRLFCPSTTSNNNTVLFNSNRGLALHQISVEHGTLDFTTGETKSAVLSMTEKSSIEKNWVLFENTEGILHHVYYWHPLRIGRTNEENSLQIEYVYETPLLFKQLRGSTNGIRIGDDEIWFLCHMVSYEERRHYYHLFVVLDAKTMQLKKYSKLFKFEGDYVEYALGLQERDAHLYISYSTMDKTSKLCVVPLNDLNSYF